MGIKMDISAVLKKVDSLYEKNQGAEAEKLLQESAAQAAEEQDSGSLLQILNELLGYYRETGRKEASFQVAERAVSLALDMGLENTIPYATTLLNVANAYRAGGDTERSLECYLQVQEIYGKLISPDNMLMAGLLNNMSLLYQERGEFQKARECLENALAVAEKKDAEFEVAVTCANLAGTCMQLGRDEEAFAYARRSITGFEKMNIQDTHYCAALSALGTYLYKRKEYGTALSAFQRAMGIVEAGLGQNEHYRRLKKNAEACEEKMLQEGNRKDKRTQSSVPGEDLPDRKEDAVQGDAVKGMGLCREVYEKYGHPMLQRKFPEYMDKIAVGLVGEGSDCFGWDDAYSRDHDWGDGFCIWVTEDVWDTVREALSEAYEEIVREGFHAENRSHATAFGQGRRGVMTAGAFYKRLLHTDRYELIDWRNVEDAALAAAVNGEVFYDGNGAFSDFRKKLMNGYPEEIRFLKLSESAAKFSQTAQYNYERMKKRGDGLTAEIMLSDGMREAMKLQHYIEGKYPPHDKWLYRSTGQLAGGEKLCGLLEQLAQEKDSAEDLTEQIAEYLAKQMYAQSLISDTEVYLDAHTQELLYKAGTAGKSNEELAEEIARLEFQAFDKVHNYGGRAGCQNDWATFSIMRRSQYLTWSRTMLQQYLYDFQREFSRGHNLIEEKYGRMMESTAPEEYESLKDYFPVLSAEKKQIIEQIVGVQVRWMEEFAEKYPYLADNARSVHTYDDNLYNTSYETYLRGELGTYSDKMLELYGRYVVEYAGANKNPVFDIMTNSAKLYGYADLEAAEAFLKL